ncbi:MAG: hypothetical protein AAGA15_11765, partial [Pseudomonadota bacterium]
VRVDVIKLRYWRHLMLVLILLMVISSQAAHAQRSIPLTAEPAQPYIGDVITLSFELEHSYRTRVVVPVIPEVWGEFELVSAPRLHSEGK